LSLYSLDSFRNKLLYANLHTNNSYSTIQQEQLSAVWPDVQTPKIQGKGYHTIKFTKYNLMCIQCSIINLYIWRMDHTKSLLCWCKWL